jgi:pantoate--beta-alanine ligase
MEIFTSAKELQKEATKRRTKGQRIGFVPTMGYLHAGHTSLFDIARKSCDWLICSIYVNPLQFSQNEDLNNYPQDPDGDRIKCQEHGVDALFLPTDLYSSDHSTFVTVKELSAGLCAGTRPTHFEGVTTVVARLFGIVQPTFAVFGEKDFQQLAIIKRMVRDLAMPIEIIGGPLVRDNDGLALSSRNRYLSQAERIRALSISTTLQRIQSSIKKSITPLAVPGLQKMASETLRLCELDYLEIVDPSTLKPLKEVNGPARALIAGWIGQTRLIDNMDISR